MRLAQRHKRSAVSRMVKNPLQAHLMQYARLNSVCLTALICSLLCRILIIDGVKKTLHFIDECIETT
jgi:hypothetical protein